MKIKLVSIAKDEAAYLPEWIFHHLFFGFDEIEVYVNFTTDCSYDLLKKIQINYPVKYKNSEYLIDPEYNKYDQILSDAYLKYNLFQSRAYAELLYNARKDGFSHVMFLDVDEFWTPICFSKKIKDVLNDMADPDIASFYWKNKVSDTEEFGRPFKNEILCINPNQFKSIVKTDVDIRIMNSHYFVSFDDARQAVVKDSDASNAFIMHRFQRSEVEYISILGRGDPTFAGKFGLKFTRAGYIASSKGSAISFDSNIIDIYDNAYEAFLKINDIYEYIEESKKFIKNRASFVVDYINRNTHDFNKSVQVYNLSKKLLSGVKLENFAIDSLSGLNTFNKLSESEIDMLRDIAVNIETYDLNKAYELMKIAYKHRPKGPFIKRKFEEYELKLKKLSV